MTDFHRLDADADARFLRARVADPLTRVPFRAPNEVVMCAACGLVSLRETWEALGGCPNGHATPAAWDEAAALAAGDGAAAPTPRMAPAPVPAPVPARPASAPPPVEPRRNRWQTPLLIGLGVAALVVLAIVVAGRMGGQEEEPVVQAETAPAGPTGPAAVSLSEPGLTSGVLSADDFATPDGRYQDLYTFAADSSGRVLSFTVTSGDFIPDLRVETPEGDRLDGELLSEDEDTGERVVGVQDLRGPGLYRVIVTSRQPAATGTYALRTRFEMPVRPLTPGGSAVRAELGQFSEVADGFYRDRYRFTASEGREHTITVRSGAFAPTVQVTGPSGAVRGETGRAGGVVTFVFTPARPGTHTVLVSSQSARQGGAYSVQLVVAAAEVREERAGPVSAGSLRNGQAVSDSLAASASKSYGFQGRVGDRVFLEVRADGFAPMLALVGPDGERQSASADGDRARLRVTLATAGTYRVLVGAGASGGTYRVTLEQQAAVTADDIPRLPGADTPPRPPASDDGQGEDYQPQPIGDGQ